MKKWRLRPYAAGVITCMLCLGGVTAFAGGAQKTIDAWFGKVKLVINGTPAANETLLYDGRTYVQLREAAELLGMKVDWDENTQTANIYDPTKFETENTPASSDFQSAWLDYDMQNGNITNLSSLSIYFNGNFDHVYLNDFTDMILTYDGKPVENKLIYDSCKIMSTLTKCVFIFDKRSNEPGIYGFTGKYKEVPFETKKIFIDKYPLSDEPADPNDLLSASLVPISIDGGLNYTIYFYIYFNGVQQSINSSDVSDVHMTQGGKEIPVTFKDKFSRYAGVSSDGGVYTSFSIAINGNFTLIDSLRISGKYKGKPFISDKTVTPYTFNS